MVIAHAEGIPARALRLELQLGRLWYSHLVVGEGGSGSVSHTRRVAAILVHVELLLHVVVGPGVVCGKEVGSDLIGQIRVGVGCGSVETLVASIALSLVGMGVMGIQLGVGRIASRICHANVARLLLRRWVWWVMAIPLCRRRGLCRQEATLVVAQVLGSGVPGSNDRRERCSGRETAT
jgi:hypothetical protein